MSKLKIRASAAVVIAAAVMLTACGGGGDSESESSVTAAETTPATDPPADTSPPATDPPPAEGDEPMCATIIDDEYEPIDCAEPHDAELAGFATTTSDPATDDDLDFEIALIGLCSDAVAELTRRPTSFSGS